MLETGLVVSLYTVKSWSFQRTSGLSVWELGLKDREFICEWNAALTMPHMGHPGFEVKVMVGKENKVDSGHPTPAALVSKRHSVPRKIMNETTNGLRSKQEIKSLFETIRSQLDDFQDTREKLIKVNI